MIRRIASLAKRTWSKPFDVVVFRGVQELRLEWLRRSGGWRKLSQQAEQVKCAPGDTVLLNSVLPVLSSEQLDHLAGCAGSIVESRLHIFGHSAPDLTSYDFHSDWRYNHCWEPTYFRNYDFYAPKAGKYDVKLPWEASRLSFLIPVMAFQALRGGDLATVDWVKTLVERWNRLNPLAHSVNWYPMEASMRAINLVLVLDLVWLTRRQTADDELSLLLQELSDLLAQMIFKNASFVWLTREYTDVRGNHFTANLAALYLSALALQNSVEESEKWQRYARTRLESEIHLQFTEDGVNFEKAAGYHKLVLELFALSGIAAERKGEPFTEAALSLLENAATFSDAITRPDGLAVNFGDTDDASAISFAMEAARSHGAIIEVIRAWRDKPLGAAMFGESHALAAQFLLGRRFPLLESPAGIEIRVFDGGGFYVARDLDAGFFFMADMGEVGMNGRGGHGHNDLFSFELFIHGEPVVLDPGCSGYTADLEKRRLYRSTAAHSTVQLFDQEMADLTGHWTISAHALPNNVVFQEQRTGFRLSGSHNGYSRIQPGTTVQRTFTVDGEEQTLSIQDNITTQEAGGAAWHFPIGPTEVHLSPYRALIGSTQLSSAVELALRPALFSTGYAQEDCGSAIVAQARLAAGENTFEFHFRPKKD